MNRTVFFPAELKFVRLNSPNISTFLLVVQLMMQVKFNFNNFIFYSVCLPQLGSMPAAYAVVAGGCDWSIQ